MVEMIVMHVVVEVGKVVDAVESVTPSRLVVGCWLELISLAVHYNTPLTE
jgi:hypothetical protein